MVSNLLKLFHEAHPYLLALGTAEGSILKTGGNVQFNLFMQNKPNFLKCLMNINFYLTNYYKQKLPLRQPAKQTQSNPISDPTNSLQKNTKKHISYLHGTIFLIGNWPAGINPASLTSGTDPKPYILLLPGVYDVPWPSRISSKKLLTFHLLAG